MFFIPPTSPWQPRRLARTGGFVLGAMAIAGTAFLAVLRFQPAVAPAASVGPAVPSLTTLDPDPPMRGGMGPVERPAINNMVDGKLVSDFAAADFSPRRESKDGTVDVVKPRARFYLKNGQCLVVTGDTGEVAFGKPGGSDSAGMMSVGTKMPDTGKLHHVHIQLFPTTPPGPRPTLTMDTDNVRFDNDTLRLYTEKIPATATEPEVTADRVPVVVRGDDYNMDGTGLTLRLSAGATSRDRQLHLLEISHGIRLTILHPAAMGQHHDAPPTTNQSPAAPPRVPPSGPEKPMTPAKPAEPAAEPLGSDGHAPVAIAAPAPPPQAYRAVFNDQVRIVEGDPSAAPPQDRTIGTGDVLTLDFSQKHGTDAKPVPTTKPAAPSTTPAPPTTAAVVVAPTPTTVPVATTGPTKLGEEPITVYWTGKLRVTPIELLATMMPLEAGQAAVRLAGRPARLTFNGAVAEAAVATYRSVDDAVRLEPSPAWPVVKLSQPLKGLALDARSVEYDPATSVATILGPATLHVAEAGRHITMTATWADRGLLHVIDAGADPSGVDHIDLIGDVHADDPKFSLSSHRLLLDLDSPPPTTRPGVKSEAQLRRLTAVGDVVCRLLRPGQPDEGIEGDRLVVGMTPGPDGTLSPHDVLADGRQVHAFDATQALFADHLEAVLSPKATAATKAVATTSPADGGMAAVSLESMVATGHVKAALKNGATAVADLLRETTAADGRQFVELSGIGGARVTDAKLDELVGPVLHVTDRGVVVVDGPGTLHTTGKPATRPAAGTGGKPIDVSWTDGLSFDSTANTADVVGHVLVRSIDPNGTVNRAAGDKAHIDFEDAPKPKRPTSRKAQDAGDNLGSKQLKRLTLAGHMVAESELDDGGKVERFGRLKGDRLIYTASDGIARVPGPGTLFVEKHRPTTTAPSAGGSDGKAGTMAIGWQGGLAYNQLSGLIHIVGDVRVGFLQDSAKNTDGGPMQMRSDDLLITMAKTAGGDPGKQPISRLVGTGGVHMNARSMDMHCHRIDFSPVTGLMTATASDAEPGRAVGSAAGSASGGFGLMVFNTNANTVEHVEDVNGSFRR